MSNHKDLDFKYNLVIDIVGCNLGIFDGMCLGCRVILSGFGVMVKWVFRNML